MIGSERIAGLGLLLLLALVVAPGLSCVSTAPDQRTIQILNQQGFGKPFTGDVTERDYVTIGDSVYYEDAFNPELKGTERIAIDGTIVVPEAGAVQVAGQTREQIQALLTAKFSPYYSRVSITVKITTTAQKFYFLLGEVAQEGPRPFRGNLTVFEVIADARVNPNSSALNRVKVIRADPRDPLVITVPYSEMLRTGDFTYNIVIKENDIVVVPPTMLAEVGYFIQDLIYPVTSTAQTIVQSLFAYNQFSNFGSNNRYGTGNNQSYNVF